MELNEARKILLNDISTVDTYIIYMNDDGDCVEINPFYVYKWGTAHEIKWGKYENVAEDLIKAYGEAHNLVYFAISIHTKTRLK